MILVSYDISNDKLRTKFSKFLSKFGHRKQYSMFEIDNGSRVLGNIILTIQDKFEPYFEQTDSVMIFNMSAQCKIYRMGYEKNDEKSLFVL